MSSEVHIVRIDYENYKALRKLALHLDHMNVLVGPNNSGKSTIISSLRALDTAIRHARAKSPGWIKVDGLDRLGYTLNTMSLPISTDNVSTNYDNVCAKVHYKLSNGTKLELGFPTQNSCYFCVEGPRGTPKTPVQFRADVPLVLTCIPQLGPVEREELLVEPKTVNSNLNTQRASRNFRNYWHYNPDNFEAFASLVKTTWPGLAIQKPELDKTPPPTLSMFCTEDRFTIELHWAGVGFQVWCQLLTHIARAKDSSIIVVDEPEIYLHPDVQRQLLNLLRKQKVDVIIATHSSEIMGEADPDEIIVLDKRKQTAKHIKDVEGVQIALDNIGSIHNITLAQLARTKRAIFTEGSFDYKVLRRFAAILDFHDLAAGAGMTAFESEGFASWQKIRDFSWGLEKTVGKTLHIASVFDRDYFCDEQLLEVQNELGSRVDLVYILKRKEIENYLLSPIPLQKAVDRALSENHKRTGREVKSVDISKILDEVTLTFKADAQSQYLGKRSDYLRGTGKNITTLNRETLSWFEQLWINLDSRLQIVPGKEVLAKFREHIQKALGVNITDNKILSAFSKSDVASDMSELIMKLEKYRLQNTG